MAVLILPLAQIMGGQPSEAGTGVQWEQNLPKGPSRLLIPDQLTRVKHGATGQLSCLSYYKIQNLPPGLLGDLKGVVYIRTKEIYTKSNYREPGSR